MKNHLTTLLAFSTFLTSSLAYGQSIITVDTVDDMAVNISDDTITLREAINQANSGDTINFNSSLSGQIITLSEGQLNIDKTLTIDASDLPDGITIDANKLSRIMQITSTGNTSNSNTGSLSSIILHSLTLTGGKATEPSTTSLGGAIYNQQANLTLMQCTVAANVAIYGGGIYNESNSEGNASLSLISSTLSENSASQNGGGIFNTGFEGNSSVSILTSTLSKNIAAARGGGIFNNDENASISAQNSIIAANIAPLASDISNLNNSILTSGNNLFSSLENSGLTEFTAGIIVSDNPLLAPLAKNGGATKTMHPLAGSPAILNESVTRIDQRGFNLTGKNTIGAVQLGNTVTVNNEATLRDAFTNSAGTQGRVIYFDDSLDGGTITLSSGELLIPSLSEGLFIDASSLANGITIDANGSVTNHRVIQIHANSAVTLHSLTLTGGNALGFFPTGYGGAILSGGNEATFGDNHYNSLTLISSTISNNTANISGSGIFSVAHTSSNSFLAIIDTTVSNNISNISNTPIFTGGGAVASLTRAGSIFTSIKSSVIYNNTSSVNFTGGVFSNAGLQGQAHLSITSSTIYANSGDGVYSVGGIGDSSLSIESSTIYGNSDDGIRFSGDDYSSSHTFSLRDSIVAANSRDISSGHPIIALGNNIISNSRRLPGSFFPFSSGLIMISDPLLTPLGDYGGPTKTILPLPGSPAINAATSSKLPTDQRGVIISNGAADIGATEFKSSDIPSILSNSTHDQDGDGTPTLLELALGTNPFTPDAESERNLAVSFENGQPQITFGYMNNVSDSIAIRLQKSTDLINFEELALDLNNNQSTESVEMDNLLKVEDPTTSQKTFYRLEAELLEDE